MAGLFVHTSNRLEDLAEALATVLAAAPLPPLVDEIVVVPSQGIGRWLRQSLAERHGIVAGLRLPFVGTWFHEMLVRPDDRADPFAKDALVFRLWQLLGDPAAARELQPAVDYCRDDADDRKKLQLCLRLAGVLDDYQLWRPDLLQRWSAGDDTSELGPHAGWQARLWRRLLPEGTRAAPRKRRRREQDATLFQAAPAKALASVPIRVAAMRELLADPARARAALPARLSVFGAATLPPVFVELLASCSAHVPVHLFVPEPAPLAAGDGDNPWLAAFAQETREFASVLAALDDRGDTTVHRFDLGAMSGRENHWPAATVLQHVQQSIGDLEAPRGGRPRHRIDPNDDSLRVHDCHSPHRELEVVRDQILAAFAADPTLQPHDVVVQVPDIETYAPVAQAVFGPVRAYLPFHVADRSPARDLPLCNTVFALLELAVDRVEVHDVFRILEEPAVHRRFGLSLPDLPMLRSRCEQAGIRWGIDAESRAKSCRLPPFDDNAWRPGLERLLLGVATGPCDELVLGVLPVADATSGRDEPLARFLAFAETLFAALPALQRPHPLPAWADLIAQTIAALFRPATIEEEGELARLGACLSRMRELAAQTALVDPLPPAAVRDWLAHSLQQATGTRGFLAGAVTVASVQPLRTVPARLLFVCGLADGTFPRQHRPLAFDLMACARRPGDRDVRLDDRQLFLDLLLAARDKLHLTFVGRSQKDDSECAPSVLLLALLERIDASCTTAATGQRPSDLLRVRHPLQPWSRRYRTGDDARLFTYGTSTRALPDRADDEPAWFQAPLAPPAELLGPELSLGRLLEFWKSPCRFFLREVVDVRLRGEDEGSDTTEPFALDALEVWRVQDQLARIGDRPLAARKALLRQSGLLPVAGPGDAEFATLDDEVQALLATVRTFGEPASRSLRITHGGVRLSGEIDGVTATCLLRSRVATLKAKDQLAAWIVHVVVAIARHAGETWPAETIVVARDQAIRLQALTADDAARALDTLLAGYRAGLTAPLPFFPATSSAWAEASSDPAAADRKARTKWQPRHNMTGASDSENRDHMLCFRQRDPLATAEFRDWAGRVFHAMAPHTRSLS